jgi:hypothetical protein
MATKQQQLTISVSTINEIMTQITAEKVFQFNFIVIIFRL